MELVGDDRVTMIAVVKQGIDAHLEAFTSSTFKDSGRRLSCHVSNEDMLVLLRRLNEIDNEHAMWLRTSILSMYDIEEM